MCLRRTSIQRRNGPRVLFHWRLQNDFSLFWIHIVVLAAKFFDTFSFILQFFQPALSRTQVNSITGEINHDRNISLDIFHNCMRCFCNEFHSMLRHSFLQHQIFFTSGSISKFACENRLLWQTDAAQDYITPRGLPHRIFDKGKPIPSSWSIPTKGPSSLSPLKKLM